MMLFASKIRRAAFEEALAAKPAFDINVSGVLQWERNIRAKMEGKQADEPAGLLPSYEELVHRAIKNATSSMGFVKWVEVGRVFGVGPSVAKKLCERAGVNPDVEGKQ